MGKLIDLTGERFGRLTVVEKVCKPGETRAYWRCKCDCGNETITSGRDLRTSHSQSCGCYCREKNSILKTKDMIGQKFGRLTVIRREGTSQDGCALWQCKCECGNDVIVKGGNLRSGNTTSCGCYHTEIVSETNRKKNTTHGLTNTRLYTIWTDMKQRCGNPNAKDFRLYGERGISVCDEWAKDFKKFYDWAMKNGYRDDLTIDRIDNDKGYYPGNCRWSTHKEQANNKRSRNVEWEDTHE